MQPVSAGTRDEQKLAQRRHKAASTEYYDH
jgi:hypothetical protein